MFLYENHMGGLYFAEEELDWEELYCGTCGDSDWPLGECNTREEALALIATDYDVYGGYGKDYVEELLNQTFGREADTLPDETFDTADTDTE